MIITYYGAACFKVQAGETVLAFNPPSKNSEFKSPRFQTNAVLISINHKDYNGQENLSGKEEGIPPLVIDGPGEYEIKGIHINGIPQKQNTIYSLSFEDINFCHFGAFTENNLSSELKGQIGEVDILFIPVNGLDSQKAAKISSQIEPKIIIPMHYKESSLKQFLKEFGNGTIQPVEKLTIKKKDLEENKVQVVILKPCL